MLVSTRRDYLDSVVYVHRVLTESQYCIYVNYDSDSDGEGMNEWEVKSILDNIVVVVEMHLICNRKGLMQSEHAQSEYFTINTHAHTHNDNDIYRYIQWLDNADISQYSIVCY